MEYISFGSLVLTMLIVWVALVNYKIVVEKADGKTQFYIEKK